MITKMYPTCRFISGEVEKIVPTPDSSFFKLVSDFLGLLKVVQR
ncbi:hypothetical protein Cpin_7077 [Chitinophaga pinensis DSM 2588]|uniref:Uncharacterized protein n=1 Tax=Chitinophaga pinensis (strain ATCC 43595 / DSM 2588 / LMG 13176 / NBRC 15968 / NCIMB 11800 / UQM 2034) TaxID=485918 RepID=A0A979GBQ8_CHIPD|nr:hypothetical protein Cpin_7077 [Chitinophaga pinensis DSM 2588]